MRIPKYHRIIYANFGCDIQPEKSETHRDCMTASGDKLDYQADANSHAVSIPNEKMHINITIYDTKTSPVTYG